ncbi:TOBE domain-containing protein [Acetohalobium arabaticum]|uniref:TOBE domain protein n=1 Tax=Acetohalobium arabaticum (strain ATCC 49924 / DSM 5501 / Z-7288) TaxID=574087 RepID=D9QQS3_ACEAZ|nr:TOBE domain-containing protein [Acetohalobium arabaticum]ADL12864.1 TOBE domain protein [Acetohalobium arabaticum DSM 5501]
MSLSARNRLTGSIKDIKSDDVSSEIILNIGGQEVCSTITTNSVERLNLEVGDEVTAAIKASNVIIQK